MLPGANYQGLCQLHPLLHQLPQLLAEVDLAVVSLGVEAVGQLRESTMLTVVRTFAVHRFSPFLSRVRFQELL